jgi:hypothetical protein
VAPVLRVFFTSLVLAALGAGVASAQTINFQLLAIPVSGNPATVPNDQTIALSAPNVGAQTQVTIVATYTGSTSATIPMPPQVLGSIQIKVTEPPTESFPLVLMPSQKLTFTVTYTAANASLVSAQVTVPYTEPATPPASGTISNAISLIFVGEAPLFTLSYFITPTNGSNPNILPIAPGGTITFPPTQLNTTASGGLQVNNVGSGPGAVTGVALLSGAPFFQLAGVPLITPTVPATLTPGTTSQTLEIGILYTPTAVETDMGQIQITYQDGTTALINLSGSGATSSYSYTYLSGTTTTPVKAGGTITFPPVTVATTGTTTPASSSVIVTVKNAGNANGTINSINVVPNPPFQLSGISTTPPILKPGDVEGFTLTYTPTAVGPQTGTLQVGSDTFTLAGTGLGPQLAYSYTSNGTTISTSQVTGVVFPSIAVGKTENVNFTVTNSGTSSATITLITASPTPPFSAPTVPPSTLNPGQSTSFPITFAPNTVGPVTGALSVNGVIVPLFGGGSAPPTLPSYTLTGPSGTVSPATQENVSLTLASSYPVDIDGVLTLTTSGNFGTDSAVQFSTGNRTVDFVIPAGSTSANFAGQGSEIPLQTGTVAETITLAPTFTTASGVDLTPSSPTTLQFTVASLAPVLESAQITNATASSFTLLIVGYSTTRSLGSLNVTFNPATGFNLATPTATFDLSQVAAFWFESATSRATFGGQFEVTIGFTLTGPVSKTSTLIQAIASVSATISNSIGTSNSVQAPVQ